MTQHGWAHVSGVLVWHVRAVGASGEEPGACIRGLGAARCGRSCMGSCGGHMEVAWRSCGGSVAVTLTISQPVVVVESRLQLY